MKFLLSNGKGGYFSLGYRSKFSGLFFNINNKLYRILDGIKFKGGKLKNFFDFVELGKAKFQLYSNSLIFESAEDDNNNNIEFMFDVKESYDSREWGRNYKVYEEHGCTTVQFTKTTHSSEDNSNGKHEYTLYAVIKSSQSLRKSGNWTEQWYSDDRKRKSGPFERYVYSALKGKSNRFVMTVSDNKKKAMKECRILYNKFKFYKPPVYKKFKDAKLNLAYQSAVNSLDSLVVSHKDIYAGLPWFFQFWTRDETISLRALMLQKRFSLAKNVLFKYLRAISFNARVPNRVPGTVTGSADGTGWVFKRIADMIQLLKKYHMLNAYLKPDEVKYITRKLQRAIHLMIKQHVDDAFVFNKAQETWMDTIDRSGARIEIQALQLHMYKLMFELTNDRRYDMLKSRLRAKTRIKFWNGKYLADGLDDFIVRPNIFIAAYIYPELLTKEEWTKCFDYALKKLWLPWGGLATLDKTHPKFKSEYTGETNESYHNGDSWFWVNNMAALAMQKINKKKFKKYIDKILEASSKEILELGLIGHHAEVSSAKELRSEGCWAQAWSAAMFIELVDEVY